MSSSEGDYDGPPEMFYIGTERPENLDDGRAHPLVRLTVVWLPVDDLPGASGAVSVGMEIGEPLEARVINAREVFAILHRLLPSMERKLRAEWVTWRKQAAESGHDLGLCADCARDYHVNHREDLAAGCTRCPCQWGASEAGS